MDDAENTVEEFQNSFSLAASKKQQSEQMGEQDSLNSSHQPEPSAKDTSQSIPPAPIQQPAQTIGTLAQFKTNKLYQKFLKESTPQKHKPDSVMLTPPPKPRTLVKRTPPRSDFVVTLTQAESAVEL